MLKRIQKYCSGKSNQSACERLFLKTFKDDAFLSEIGSEFHSLDADTEKERSYREVRDLGTAREPLTDESYPRVNILL